MLCVASSSSSSSSSPAAHAETDAPDTNEGGGVRRNAAPAAPAAPTPAVEDNTTIASIGGDRARGVRLDECDHLVVGAAGVHGVAYVGALKALEAFFRFPRPDSTQSEHSAERGGGGDDDDWSTFLDRLKGVAGTSFGACVALLLCLKLHSDEFLPVVAHLIDDVTHVFQHIDLSKALTSYGLDDGQYVKSVLADLLRLAGLAEDITLRRLRELTHKDFRCVALDVSRGVGVTFSAQSHPALRVVDAVYASLCVPCVFAPQLIDGRYHVDGGLYQMLPKCFDREERTLFLYTFGRAPNDIVDVKTYGLALIQSALRASQEFDSSADRTGHHLAICVDEFDARCSFDFHAAHDTQRYLAHGFRTVLRALAHDQPDDHQTPRQHHRDNHRLRPLPPTALPDALASLALLVIARASSSSEDAAES